MGSHFITNWSLWHNIFILGWTDKIVNITHSDTLYYTCSLRKMDNYFIKYMANRDVGKLKNFATHYKVLQPDSYFSNCVKNVYGK